MCATSSRSSTSATASKPSSSHTEPDSQSRTEHLRPPADIDLRAALSAVCTEVAALLGEAASGTWAIWRVRVIAFEGKAGEQIAAVITCVADALARELKLEQGNVFVTYEEATSGASTRVVRS